MEYIYKYLSYATWLVRAHTLSNYTTQLHATHFKDRKSMLPNTAHTLPCNGGLMLARWPFFSSCEP